MRNYSLFELFQPIDSIDNIDNNDMIFYFLFQKSRDAFSDAAAYPSPD